MGDGLSRIHLVFLNIEKKDIGTTTRNSLFSAKSSNPNAKLVRHKAEELNKTSSSNGSLMRITPMAIYSSKIEDPKLYELAIRSETSLTHSNLNIQQACVCYCLAIRTLISTLGDRKKAYETAKYFFMVLIMFREWAFKNGTDEIKSWFNLIESSEKVF